MRRYLILFVFALVLGTAASAQYPQKKPNILLIIADDLGWTDLSCYGSSFYETPNLDKLASKGIRFTQHYATSPVCSPTRASIFTGKYPVKTGVTDWIRGRQEDGKAQPYEKLIAKATAYQLGLGEQTIAELAADNGYETFFAGKWHLGEEDKFWPEHQGFQINKGGWSKGAPNGKINDSTGGYFTPYKNPRLADGPRGEYLTDRLADECISFMDTTKSKPFFMVYSLYAVHNPLQAPAKLVLKYQEKQKAAGFGKADRFTKNESWMMHDPDWRTRLVQDNPVYAAMIENMDWNVGRLLDKLAQMGIDDNTLVIFTSDNGGLSTAEGSPTSNEPLRAGKGWLYEGGIRVPLMMYWKDKITANTVSDLPVHSADLFPTLAPIMESNYKKPTDLDGENILSLIAHRGSKEDRSIFWHYPHYSNQGGTPSSAIREGNYKLIYFYEDKSFELYDIAHDISEKHNIASDNRALTQRLGKQLMQWLNKTKALTPDPNPKFNPGSVPTTSHKSE